MLKLIRLEIKKFKLFSYWKTVVIANLAILILLFMMYFTNEKLETYNEVFTNMGALIRATFTIFAAVIISRIIIDEYKNNSITLMFMYPIKRKKIMVAKLIIIACFTFLTIFLSNIFIGTVYYLSDSAFHLIPESLTLEVLRKGLFDMTLASIASAGIGLIPLYFGMMRKSVPATIVSSIVMVSITSNGGVTDFSIIAIPITLAVVGCLIAFFSIRNVEKADV